MNILLLMGGWSSERDVSLAGCAAVEKTLVALGHTVTRFDPQFSLTGLLAAAEKADFAFLGLHGSPGEDGLVQALLETVGCPYQGAGPAASFLALNKAAAKELFRHHGLPTADWALLPRRPERGWKPPFPLPLFIKGNTGGSSLGMERVTAPEDIEPALDRLFTQGGEYIVEPEISGYELTCGVLAKPEGGEEALPPILIRPKASPNGDGAFFDYVSKYTPGGAEEICPAPIPQELSAAIQEAALAVHRLLGLSDYSRTDFIVKSDGSFVVLEVNTLPGMTTTSLVPQEAAAAGISFGQLLERLIACGLADARKTRNRRQ